MNITVNLNDVNGNPLELGDVCIIKYPETKMAFVGTVQFSQEELRFFLKGDFIEESLPTFSWAKLHRLGPASAAPQFEQFMGRTEVKNMKDAKAWHQHINNIAEQYQQHQI